MSLHGSIKVNEHIVGYWTAQRVVTADPNIYDCVVYHDPEDGPAIRGEFAIQHRFQDGAVALAAKVLQRSLSEGDASQQDPLEALRTLIDTPDFKAAGGLVKVSSLRALLGVSA